MPSNATRQRIAKRDFVDPPEALRRLISRATPRLRDRYLALVSFLQRSATLREIEDAITSGNVFATLENLEQIAARLSGGVEQVYIDAGQQAAGRVSRGLDVIIEFEASNPRAVRELANSTARIKQAFGEQTRAAARRALFEAQERGLNPRATARLFRSSLGLTPRQVSAVGNFRRMLEELDPEALTRALRDRRFDRTILRAIDSDSPLSKADIDRMVDRYRSGYIKYRSEVIARTEALQAVHAGTFELYEQGFDSGLLDPEKATREWNTADDGRERDSHNAMDNQKRKPGETFTSGEGFALRYPGDPEAPIEETAQCRCAVGTRISL